MYQAGTPENTRIVGALDAYGADRFSSELKYCVDELLKVCDAGNSSKLRNIIFEKRSTNAFPAVFTNLMIALHESLIGGHKKIANYAGVKKAISGLYGRIETSRRSTAPEERQRMSIRLRG